MGTGSTRVTIGDVADRAGVSIATVSRVVNGRYGVATETNERVRAVIDNLGYESSLVARSLRSQRRFARGKRTAHDAIPRAGRIEPHGRRNLHGRDCR